MKTKKLATALAMSTIALLTGCGSSGNNNVGSNLGPQIGCAQWSGTTCVAPIYATPGGCVPINQPIYFAGSGQIMGSTLAAGAIPSYQTFGALSVTATPINSVGGQTYTSPSGLSLNVNSGYAGSGGMASLSGSMQLSQAAQYNIITSSQGSYSWGSFSPYGSSPNGMGYGSGVCVSGIALQLGGYPSVNGVYGYVYLYLNNTQHGYVLQVY